jgi:alpha 1,2-mannosyltransferase
MLKKSLDLLYLNYNDEFRNDVLIFHSGAYTAEDELELRKDGTRNEIHVIMLEEGTKFWSVPQFINQDTYSQWVGAPGFSIGYRHMCRWYAAMLFEFAEQLGYEYVMRFDEDSYILSEIKYDLFEFMKREDKSYAFRIDSFEICCHDPVRQALVRRFLDVSGYDFSQGFFGDCCHAPGDMLYTQYGYYNNFFIGKVGFFRQDNVRRLFEFFDWSGSIYYQRENDLMVQSLSVQLFLHKDQVHKFEDWSYEHVSGKTCENGGVVKGTDDKGVLATDSILHFEEHGFAVPLGSKGENITELYCDMSRYNNPVYTSSVLFNYHGKSPGPWFYEKKKVFRYG